MKEAGRLETEKDREREREREREIGRSNPSVPYINLTLGSSYSCYRDSSFVKKFEGMTSGVCTSWVCSTCV